MKVGAYILTGQAGLSSTNKPFYKNVMVNSGKMKFLQCPQSEKRRRCPVTQDYLGCSHMRIQFK